MTQSICAITCTSGRPEAFRRCIHYMSQQTHLPDEWVISTDEALVIPQLASRTVIRRHQPIKPWDNFIANLWNALTLALETKCDLFAFIEDDDWYGPMYLEHACGRAGPIAGMTKGLQYFNVGLRAIWENPHYKYAPLAATVVNVAGLAALYGQLLEDSSKGFDRRLWEALNPTGSAAIYSNDRMRRCVSIKGMPGPKNLGVGSDPTIEWRVPDDFDLELEHAIGKADADYYRIRRHQ